LRIMLDTHRDLIERNAAASVIVASTRDGQSGGFTYGGYVNVGSWSNPMRLQLQPPGPDPIRCDTMCGNCVLIPRQVTAVVGNIDPAYRHRWGDVDYGFRARRSGCQVWIAPGYLAECESNPNADRWRDSSWSFRARVKELHSLKGLGKHDWMRFIRTHGGAFWVLTWIRPYVRLLYDTFR